MNRYYSDSDDAYYVTRPQSDNIHASGWQSPLPTTDGISSPSSSITRIVVECPFGSKKCNYSIDKSQRGRLIVTIRRRHTFKSDYLSLNNKNNIAIQTFTIPYDADIDHLKSYVERYTNRLIIEIPRLSSSYINNNHTYRHLIHSPNILTSSIGASQLIYDDIKPNRKFFHNNEKLEYLIDCHGYTADELDVFIQDQNLIIHGQTKQIKSDDPTQENILKKFSRKISLPYTVDLSKVISYLKNGQLRIEAPLKREFYSNNTEILLPESQLTTIPNRTFVEYNRIQSPISSNRQHEYVNHRRKYDRNNIHRPSSPMRRVYSTEYLNYPLYRSSEDMNNDGDDEDDSRQGQHRQTVNYERYITRRHGTRQPPIYRSTYSPTNHIVRTTTHHNYPIDENMYYRY
ncbi:unnamed protein product [Rotaria sp. Silwood1]|nr:unnamed protein product [Rotaria sp. Silwood1]